MNFPKPVLIISGQDPGTMVVISILAAVLMDYFDPSAGSLL